MRRDAIYALLAALALILIAGIWALMNPQILADPGEPRARMAMAAALPVPAGLPSQDAARQRALQRLADRDLFVAQISDEEELRRFAAAKIDRPVTLRPVRASPRGFPAFPSEDRSRATVRPNISQSPRTAPSAAPAQPLQTAPVPLRLRGVFPNPSDGGRALLATSDGRVFSVGLGGVLAGWQLLRIGPSSITLAGPAGDLREIRMPGY